MAPSTPTPEILADRIRSGDRTTLARAMTLVESRLEADQDVAAETLRLLMPDIGSTHRIGVSGPPGVGKSTLIDTLGMRLLEQGHRVAVLAIDPSSSRSGGSILGDKSRMSRLALEDAAFIRPSPSDLALGGVTRRTREVMFLCEAAGFDRLLIETVGVGQSEIEVEGLTDSFLVLIQPGSGDELQGIKKGILEVADAIAVNKADGEGLALARETVAEYSAALRYQRSRLEGWTPTVTAISGKVGTGVEELVDVLAEHRKALVASGQWESRRTEGLEAWVRQLAEEALLRAWRAAPDLGERLKVQADRVATGELTCRRAADELADH